MNFVLVHSPLVGADAWTAVAQLLRTQGHEAAVPDLAPVMQGGGPYYEKLAGIAAAPVRDGAVLVVHSGAGALVPAIAERATLAGAIFVDALQPYPGKPWFDSAPQALNARIRGLEQGGRLPPWHLWWPKGAIEALLPEPDMYHRFAAGLSSLPLAYFEERAPDTVLETPSAYLQLSDACKADADRAEAEGWPVARLTLHHLAMLTHPDIVARQIERFAAGLKS